MPDAIAIADATSRYAVIEPLMLILLHAAEQRRLRCRCVFALIATRTPAFDISITPPAMPF